MAVRERMLPTPEMPKELLPCETCGHKPDEAKRLAWLAGCPDGHVLHMWFDINYLAEKLVHIWPDRTYSALRVPTDCKPTEDLMTAWLDWAHDGKTTRRPAYTNEIPVYDDVIATRTQDPVTGDTTVTYTFPERG